MANHTTGSQRYNARMNKIWEKSKQIKEKENLLKTYASLRSAGYSKETARYIIKSRLQDKKKMRKLS